MIKIIREESIFLTIILSSFKGTLFRQTMFAEFEMTAHKMVEEGNVLTADNCVMYTESLMKSILEVSVLLMMR